MLRAARGPSAFSVLGVVLALFVPGCGRRANPPVVAIHLIDQYKPEMVEGRFTGEAPTPPRTEWRFDGAGAADGAAEAPKKNATTRGWEAGPGVAELAIKDGRLAGRTTADIPILHVERTTGLEDGDLLHAIEIRARISEGKQLQATYDDTETVDLADIASRAKERPWRLKTPIVAGDEIRTYTLDARGLPAAATASQLRHLMIQPSDVKGARFEIESVRLVFRKEYLAGLPSGRGWQGLAEIYHETLTGRSPEAIRIPVNVPQRAQLDLAIGTVEYGPMTFRVGVRPTGATADDLLLDRTLTTPYRWEPAPVDLSRFAGQQVTLSLSLSSEHAGGLGFWGSPTVRSLGAIPPPTGPARADATRPRGVILIWADTLRRDHVSAYGYQRDTTPTIRRMAEEGTLFRDCIGQATWTKVATPSLMTSLYPATHGVRDFSDRLPSEAVTLAEVFRDAGYATLSMASVIFTGKFTNLHQGFEELHEDSSLPQGGGRNGAYPSKSARTYVDRLLPWLEAHREVPFFVFLHVTDPHDPYKPYPPYDTLWGDASKEGEHERQAKEVRKFISAPLLKLFGMPTRDDLKRANFDPDAYVAFDRDWYDGSIRGMDAEIARLLERLRGLGLDDKTLVVFTADHGEEFLEHGRTFHGQSTYGELSNLPLVMRGPGVVPKGKVVEDTVQTIDIMPTILEISQLPIPAAAQGHSLVSLLSGPSKGEVKAAEPNADRVAITEKAKTSEPVGAPPPQDTESFSIVAGRWKLVWNTLRPSGGPEFELYDHVADPLNAHDVASEHPDVVQRLTKDLGEWRKKAEAARLKPDAGAAEGMSKENLERLKALGYVQ